MSTAAVISPLAMELALSKVSLAALKARERRPPNADELQSAREICDVLRRDLELRRAPTPLKKEAVPDKGMRQTLEKALETIGQPNPRLPLDVAALETMLTLVSRLLERRPLGPVNATQLLDLLDQAERARERRPPTALVFSDLEALKKRR
jgi:hypothetical protein